MSRAVRPDISSQRHAATPPATTVAAGPGHQAYRILRVGYTALPIVAGVDKFFNLLVNWESYLLPAVPRVLQIPAETFMIAVGVIEILAGLLVAFAPRVGGYVVALWLWGIIANLLLIPNYYDIALRDFGLSLGALALALLARDFSRSARTR